MPQKRHAASGLGVAAVIVQSVEEEFSEVLGMCDTIVRFLVSVPGGSGVFFACQPCLVIIVPASKFHTGVLYLTAYVLSVPSILL